MKLTPEQYTVAIVGAAAGSLALEYPEGLSVEHFERMKPVMAWFAAHSVGIPDDLDTAEVFISLAEQAIEEAES